MAGKPLSEIVEAGWARALAPVEPVVAQMGEFLRAEIAARPPVPAGRGERAARVHAAVRRGPRADRRAGPVPDARARRRAVVLGGAGRAADPALLANIYREYSDDLGHPAPSNGDLTPWADRGVLLLNRVLTVEPGQPGSHRGKGWEAVTEQAIRALVEREGEPLVAILWGRDARNLRPAAGRRARTWSRRTRRPMSADRGFFGSRPFSRVNALLEELGGEPVDWKLP